jgi:hypothetical protein
MSESVQGVLVDLPVFHDQIKIPAGVSNEIEVLKGLPSTTRRSANAASSTTPSFPGYGLRRPDRASNSAFVDVAMISASAGVYQRVSAAKRLP